MSEKMKREEVLRQKLAHLRVEHRDLDREIVTMEETKGGDLLALRRLKKRKLALKDEIARIGDQITPDIIA